MVLSEGTGGRLGLPSSPILNFKVAIQSQDILDVLQEEVYVAIYTIDDNNVWNYPIHTTWKDVTVSTVDIIPPMPNGKLAFQRHGKLIY